MLPDLKEIRKYLTLKQLCIFLAVFVFAVVGGVVAFNCLEKEVLVNDNGKTLVIRTMKNNVQDILAQAGLKVRPEDILSVPLNGTITNLKHTEISIKRSLPINVYVDGQRIKIYSAKDTVVEALKESCVNLSDEDKIDGIDPNAKLTKDMDVKVVRVKKELFAEKQTIPYKVVDKENNKMDRGTERVIREGSVGYNEKEYKVVFENGKEVVKEQTKNIVVNPIDKLVEIGTLSVFKTEQGKTFRYTKMMNMRATAYTASYADTGKHPGDPGFGITSTGIRAYKGIIAVDPNVIPLGTRVYVEVPGGADYGFALAADTGSAIKGDLIDLYFDSSSTVNSWGVRSVKVYFICD